MNTTDIMKNPAYAPILFEIESRILDSVREANAGGINLYDSHLRSILNKVRKTSEGGDPKIPDESPRDRLLAGLHRELVAARTCVLLESEKGEQHPLPAKLWALCIRTIEDSIQRHSSGTGSKGYQAFLRSFIGKARNG